MKKIPSAILVIAIFAVMVAAQAYTAFGQSANDISGSWKNGSVGSIQYRNQVTGATKSGRGSMFWYKFLPNGNYEFVGYMEVTMYHCTTTLFNQITGKYSVNGSTISLDPSRDFWKNTNSCAASGNKETTKAPTKKSLEYVVKNDEYGNDLLCLHDGSAETCYRREKE